MKTYRIHIFLLVALTFLVFSKSLTFSMLDGWDDHIYVSGNTEHLVFNVRSLLYWLRQSCEGCYLPLTMYSYMFDYAIWGLNGAGYHLQNILWHIATVIAAYLIMRHFKVDEWISFALAIIYAIHPQRVESVVWISERKDVICAALYFWSILLYLWKKDAKAFPLGSFILFIGAMLAKPMAISLPLVLLILEFSRNRSLCVRDAVKKFWPFFLVLAIFVPVTIYSQAIPESQAPILRRLFAVSHNLAWYTCKTFVPSDLAPIYPKIILSPALIIGLVIFWMALVLCSFAIFMKDKEFFLFGILPPAMCFLVSIGPVIGFVPLGAIDYADRYSYIPSVFIWLCLGIAISRFADMSCRDKNTRRQMLVARIIASALSVFTVILIALNFLYLGFWKDYPSVLRAACMHSPPSFIALGALGDFELSSGNYDAVIDISETILSRETGLVTERGHERIILKAKLLKASALYQLGRRSEALPLLLELAPEFDENAFTTQEVYKSFRAMLENCRKNHNIH